MNGNGIATIVSDGPIGAGGQGEVYKVDYNNKEYALKWYTSERIMREHEAFRKNFSENIMRGAPDDQFIWPKHVTTYVEGKGFGYLMDLIPSGFESLSDILRTYKVRADSRGNGVREPVGFRNLDKQILAAMNIVSSFRKMNNRGLNYQDLNDGGFFIDTETGNVRICDCDNVVPSGRGLGIKGKPGYMAPELVTGEVSCPNANTDKYSMAVVLFKLLMRGDPLEGRNVCRRVVLTGQAELEHYGTNPIFIFDPDDDSNAPVHGVHNNVIKNWNLYPGYLKDLFVKAFTVGLKNPDSRVIYMDWMRALTRLRSEIVTCDCGASPRFSFLSDVNDVVYRCPRCGRDHPKLHINGFDFAMTPGMVLHHDQIFGDDHSFTTDVAEVVENRKRPGLFGLKNLGIDEWTVTCIDGSTRTVPTNGGIPLSDIERIDFGMKIKGSKFDTVAEMTR